MKNNILLNCLILVSLAFTGYAATIFFNKTTPTIIVQPEAPVETIEEPDTVADFTFTDMKGDEYSLQQFKGKIVLLNFWASWCPPCIKEFPHLIEIAEQFSDQITLIALSSDHDKDAMMRFVNKLDLEGKSNILIALDEEQKITKELFGTYKLPETILITPEQIMHSKVIGGDWNKHEMENHIKLLLSNIKNST